MIIQEEEAAARRSTPHFVLVPFMAQGHMIPTLDMAYLLASRGATITFITTPVNASRNKPAIDHAKQNNLPIRFVELPFPCSEAGLPDGCESVDLVPSEDLYLPFHNAMTLLRDPLLLHLREQQQQQHPMICMISDYCNSWTMDVAKELHIPRLIFHGSSCFHIHSYRNIRLHGLRTAAAPDSFIVPGLPHQIEVTKAQVPRVFDMPELEFADDMVEEAEDTAEGEVLNTFHALESLFIESFLKTTGKGVWAIGPMFLRSNYKEVAPVMIKSWLDSMKPNSVVYASFGSVVLCSYAQIMEIGLGLEAAGRPFVWVVKEAEKSSEVEKWVSEMEERMKGRGMIIRGWAPQVAILNHEVVGGFLTHGGWNSVLEALVAGVPMATWPHFADQFLNEKLVVEVLGVGVKVGVEVDVGREDVKMAIDRLMDEREEGEERRERARELGKKARMAMEEGGSSSEDLELLIQYVSECHQESKNNEFHAVYVD